MDWLAKLLKPSQGLVRSFVKTALFPFREKVQN